MANLTGEDLSNIEVNVAQTNLLQQLDNVYDIPKLLDSEKFIELAEFDEHKQTYVVKQAITDNNQQVVIKIRQQANPTVKSQTMEIFNEVVNESFVGLFGISKLTDRKHGRCFAKILAANPDETCTPLLFKQFDWGPKVEFNPCSYVVYEFVSGTTFDSLLKNTFVSTEDLKSLLMQLFSALDYANKTIDFTHYDLHLNNVIVHTDENGNKYPVIIDYGSSHIKHKGIDYGRTVGEVSIYNRSMWFYDIVKFLMPCLYNLRIENAMADMSILLMTLYSRYRDNWFNRVPRYLRLDKERTTQLINEAFELYDQQFDRFLSRTEEFNSRINAIAKQLIVRRNYESVIYIIQLLKFFFPEADSKSFYADYAYKYPFGQPSNELIEENPNFDDFMVYAESVLQR